MRWQLPWRKSSKPKEEPASSDFCAQWANEIVTPPDPTNISLTNLIETHIDRMHCSKWKCNNRPYIVFYFHVPKYRTTMSIMTCADHEEETREMLGRIKITK